MEKFRVMQAMTIRTDSRILVTVKDCFVMAAFYIILLTMAGCTLIDDCHFAFIPFFQIMDGRVACCAVLTTLKTMYTSRKFLGFRLMARSTIYLPRYVNLLRMLLNIDNIYMAAITRIGTMD
jgi:hypothetical protein